MYALDKVDNSARNLRKTGLATGLMASLGMTPGG